MPRWLAKIGLPALACLGMVLAAPAAAEPPAASPETPAAASRPRPGPDPGATAADPKPDPSQDQADRPAAEAPPADPETGPAQEPAPCPVAGPAAGAEPRGSADPPSPAEPRPQHPPPGPGPSLRADMGFRCESDQTPQGYACRVLRRGKEVTVACAHQPAGAPRWAVCHADQSGVAWFCQVKSGGAVRLAVLPAPEAGKTLLTDLGLACPGGWQRAPGLAGPGGRPPDPSPH